MQCALRQDHCLVYIKDDQEACNLPEQRCLAGRVLKKGLQVSAQATASLCKCLPRICPGFLLQGQRLHAEAPVFKGAAPAACISYPQGC